MFLHLSVILFTGGVYRPRLRGVSAQGGVQAHAWGAVQAHAQGVSRPRPGGVFQHALRQTPQQVCKISLSFRFRISLSDMTNYKSAFGKVCRIKNRQTFKSMPILNSASYAVKYAELRIGILLKVCRFVIRRITTWYGMPN